MLIYYFIILAITIWSTLLLLVPISLDISIGLDILIIFYNPYRGPKSRSTYSTSLYNTAVISSMTTNNAAWFVLALTSERLGLCNIISYYSLYYRSPSFTTGHSTCRHCLDWSKSTQNTYNHIQFRGIKILDRELAILLKYDMLSWIPWIVFEQTKTIKQNECFSRKLYVLSRGRSLRSGHVFLSAPQFEKYWRGLMISVEP